RRGGAGTITTLEQPPGWWIRPCSSNGIQKNTRKRSTTGGIAMDEALAERLRDARVYDLEQPRFYGMPIHPAHKPGYFYSLHRRHRDGYQPQRHGPRSGASGVLTMMEHSGTHIDALCHQAFGLKLYGDIPVEGSVTPTGFTKLCIETVRPLLGRGV